tara:strand:- start:1170 stop:1448 length:279 start_codon:yes stop_codon:yes gene_type:complete
MSELDFSMKREECQKCGAVWLNGQHTWKTGKTGNELDLAGLVCNNLKEGDEELCLNPKKGLTGGDSWDYRRGYIDGALRVKLQDAKKQSDET